MRHLIAIAVIFLLAGCGGNDDPQRARHNLERKGIAFSEEAFARRAGGGDTRAVRWFLVAGMAPDAGEALVEAAHRGQHRVVEALLEAGADPNAPDEAGVPALVYASNYAGVSRNHLRAARLLLEYGADPTRAAEDDPSLTPLEVARRARPPSDELVRLLSRP